MVLNLGQHEYPEGVGDMAGAIVLIKSQKIMVFPEDDGILIKPGTHINISMKKVFNLHIWLNFLILHCIMIYFIICVTIGR